MKVKPVRKIKLKEVINNRYSLFDNEDRQLTPPEHHDTLLDAIEMAERWCTSWSDVVLSEIIPLKSNLEK